MFWFDAAESDKQPVRTVVIPNDIQSPVPNRAKTTENDTIFNYFSQLRVHGSQFPENFLKQ